MASTFIDIISQSATIITAYNTEAMYAFQPQRMFDMVAQDVSPRYTLTSNGNAAVFTIYDNLSANTGAMNTTGTTVVPTAAITNSQKTCSLYPYGDYLTIDTYALDAESFMENGSITAEALGRQAGQSVDLLARTAFEENTGSSYATNASGYTWGLTAAIIRAEDVRKAFAKLDSNNSPKPAGGYYYALAHPNVIATLRKETGSGSWREPKEYMNDAMLAIGGELGAWEGFRWISTTNVKTFNTGTQYHTYFIGQDAIGRVVSKDLQIGMHKVSSPHDNLVSMDWKMLGGWKQVRPESVYKVRSEASY